VYLWDRSAPVQPNKLIARCRSVTAVTITGDGHMLAEGCGNGVVYLWQIGSGAHAVPLGRFCDSHDAVVALDFASRRHLLAVAYGKAFGLWDIADAANPIKEKAISPALTEVLAVAISPDEWTLAVATTAAHSVELWNIRDPAHPTPGRELIGPASWVNSVAFSPDGHAIAAGSDDGLLWLFDRTTRQAIQEMPHPQPVTAADYIADGFLVPLAGDGTIRIWHPPSPEITGPGDSVFALSYDSSGRRLVVGPGTEDNTFTVWDATSQQNPRRLG